jgi:hypothetical protein
MRQPRLTARVTDAGRRCASRLGAGVPTYARGVVANWIYEDNLRLFMEALAHFACVTFDDDDWIGLEHDLILRPDQVDRERHVEWPLGTRSIRLFYEPGSSAVSFRLEADRELELRADTLVYPLQHVIVRADR